MAKTRVLIVDDSSFIRRILTDIIGENPHLEVIGTASNGREAILLAKTLAPDVITMDIEMPIMDGITAVKEIMAVKPTPILMFSSLTKVGAKATLEALEAGALDFLSKSLTDISSDTETAKRQLCARIRVLGARGLQESRLVLDNKKEKPAEPYYKNKIEPGQQGIDNFNINNYKYLLIGTSTGGPAALQEILTRLPANYPVPIVIIQHMPESFTGPFAERLNSLSKITVKLASDGDVLRAGTAYIAPGGHQLRFNNIRERVSLLIERAGNEDTYKPSVDTTYISAADQGLSNVLAIILTGMGSDGLKGVKKLKSKKATIWSQDKESSIVYGMPMSVNQEGLADHILSLSQISNALAGGE